jgi:hypothetical protein
MKITRTPRCLIAVSVLALLTSGSLLAQTMQQQPSKLAMLTNQQMVTGGVGMTIID